MTGRSITFPLEVETVIYDKSFITDMVRGVGFEPTKAYATG